MEQPIPITLSENHDDFKRLVAELKTKRNRQSKTFIVDSGASLHVISRGDLTKSELQKIKKQEQ
eukprot:3432805-Karenia_brevis.AAC.1